MRESIVQTPAVRRQAKRKQFLPLPHYFKKLAGCLLGTAGVPPALSEAKTRFHSTQFKYDLCLLESEVSFAT